MSGEIVGARHNITCIPYINATRTEEVWKERANAGNRFVRIRGASTTKDELGVQFAAGGIMVGRLVGWTGSGSKFRVTIETKAIRGIAKGSATGDFDATDFGQFCVSDAEGQLAIDTTKDDGNVMLVGGDKPNPIVAWTWPVGKKA